METRYIQKNKEGKWAISNTKTGKALRNADTQKEAIALAGSMKSTEAIMIKRSTGWAQATGWDQQIANITKSPKKEVAKKAPAKKAPAKKTAAKKAPAKKVAEVKETKKATPAKKAAAKKATPAKKAVEAKEVKKAAPAKKATPAKKTVAKKATPAKKAVEAKEVKKATPTKKAPAKKATPAKKVVVAPVVAEEKQVKMETVNTAPMTNEVVTTSEETPVTKKAFAGWLGFLIGLLIISSVIGAAFLIGYYAF